MLLVLAGVVFGFYKLQTLPGQYDDLAQCITEKEAVFYGAFWCPNCQQQKALFGRSSKYLPYVECSNPDRTQKDICVDAEIEKYPTWTLADGTARTGVITPLELAEMTSCESTLPIDNK